MAARRAPKFEAVLLHAVAQLTFWANIRRMGMLLILGVRILETIFVAGAVGSCLVLILTGIEDLGTLFGRHSAHTDKQ